MTMTAPQKNLQSLQSFVSDPDLEVSLLHTLCGSDPIAWCVISAGQAQITCCSRAFLHLWGLESANDVRPNDPRTIAGPWMNWSTLRLAMQRFGIDIQFLRDIADGYGGPGDGSLCLRRNDQFVVRVSWTVVPANGSFRGGWLIRFLTDRDAEYVDRVIGCIAQAQRKLQQLSDRERQVLQLLFDGCTNKAIAIAMEISQKTVEKHRARIMQKLKVPNTAQLFRLLTQAMLADSVREGHASDLTRNS